MRAVVVVIGALVATPTALPRAMPPAVATPPAACVNAAPDEAQATRLAVACGRRVEVLDGLSEFERHFADPDGAMTAEIAATPQRVRGADGEFVAVDPTLQAVDGGVATAATLAKIRLSAGGDGHLLSVSRNGATVSLSTSATLPAPELDGAVAVYRNVPILDVDLHVRARAEGVSTLFVVRTRHAATSSAVRQLRFGLSTSGVTARNEPTGGVSWVDGGGEVLFASGSAAMWDSTRVDPPALGHGGPVEDLGVWAPGPGARTARVPIQAGEGGLTVTPDPAFLADPANTLPLVIDPTVSRTNWAMINSRYPNQCYVMCGGYDNDDHMKTGWVPDAGGMAYRSMVDFSQASFAHKHVLDAKLTSYLLHSWPCTESRTYLHSVGAFGASTTWNNHASSWSSPSLAYVTNHNCSDTAGVRSEWGSATLTSYVHGRATANGKVYLGLKGESESSTLAWKKFDENRTTLVVTYNSYPTVPTSLGTYNQASGSAALPCASGTTRPFVRSTTPTLKAKPNDPDLAAETNLRIRFAMEKWNGTAWAAFAVVDNSTNLTVNTLGAYTIPAAWGLTHGSRIRWKAATLDPWSNGGATGTDASPYTTAWCEFEVDSQPPSAPPGVSSTVYPEYQPVVREGYFGGVGLSADFTFTAGGVPDVRGWHWGWADPPTNYLAAPAPGGSRTVSLTPPAPLPEEPTRQGPLTLYVRSVDATGIADGESALRTYLIRVADGKSPIGRWTMAETAGTTLADTNQEGVLHHATVSGATLGQPGRRAGQTSARFDGVNDFAATATGGAVIDASRSFTVSVWVRPTNVTKWASVLSQDGTASNGPFNLQLSNTGRWTWVRYSADGAPTIEYAESVGGATAGTWTHLVAVYDTGSSLGRQLRLYVNGTVVGSHVMTGPTPAFGQRLSFGRVHWSGGYTNYFAGDMAEATVWNRVLAPEQIAVLATT